VRDNAHQYYIKLKGSPGLMQGRFRTFFNIKKKNMKILKVENHNYQIIYINDNEKYQVYRRINETTWETLKKDTWKQVCDYLELEKAFNEREIKK
jgi:hypothetical protein